MSSEYIFPEKDPNEILDYLIDWSAKLSQGETLTASTITVSDGLVLDSSSFSTTATTIWLSGGTEGATANILNRVTTSQNRTMDVTALLPIRSK
jgi:hypothetical protein